MSDTSGDTSGDTSSEATVTYPLRASGEYAGTKCQLKACPKYARFLAVPIGVPGESKAVCAIHLAATVRTLHLLTGKPPVIQEIPGNWGRELVITEGELAILGSPGSPSAWDNLGTRRKDDMSRSNADTTVMLSEVRKKILAWEQAPPGSREESETAEAATRVMAELDAALCDGAHLPMEWQRAQYPDADKFLSARGHEVNDWLGPDGGDNLSFT